MLGGSNSQRTSLTGARIAEGRELPYTSRGRRLSRNTPLELPDISTLRRLSRRTPLELPTIQRERRTYRDTVLEDCQRDRRKGDHPAGILPEDNPTEYWTGRYQRRNLWQPFLDLYPGLKHVCSE